MATNLRSGVNEDFAFRLEDESSEDSSSEDDFFVEKLQMTRQELDEFDLDEELKQAVSKHLNTIYEENLDFPLLIASIIMMIRNGWRMDARLADLCNEVREPIVLKFYQSDVEQVNKENVDLALIRYCRLIHKYAP